MSQCRNGTEKETLHVIGFEIYSKIQYTLGQQRQLATILWGEWKRIPFRVKLQLELQHRSAASWTRQAEMWGKRKRAQ